jgi:hypothetical protein
MVQLSYPPLLTSIGGGSYQYWSFAGSKTVRVSVLDNPLIGSYRLSLCVALATSPSECFVNLVHDTTASFYDFTVPFSSQFVVNSTYTVTARVTDGTTRMGVFVATVLIPESAPQFTVLIASSLPSGNFLPVKRDFTLKAIVRSTNDAVPVVSAYSWSLSPASPRNDYQMVAPANQLQYYVASNTLVAGSVYIFRVSATVNGVTLVAEIQVTVYPELTGCELSVRNEVPSEQIDNYPASGVAMGSAFTMAAQQCTGGMPPFVYSFGYNSTTRLVSTAIRIASSSIPNVRFPRPATNAFAFVEDQASNSVQLTQPLRLSRMLLISDVISNCNQELSGLILIVSTNPANAMKKAIDAIRYCDPSVFVPDQYTNQDQINSLKVIFTQIYNLYSGLLEDLANSNPVSVIDTFSTSRTASFTDFTISAINTQINVISKALNSVINLDPTYLTPTVMDDMINLISSCFFALFPSTGNLNSLKARQASSDVQALALVTLQQALTAYVQGDQCVVSGTARTVTTTSLVANVRRVVYDGYNPGDISRSISETSVNIPSTIPAGCYDVQAIEWNSFRNATDILSKVISVNVYNSGTATFPTLPAGTISYSVRQNVSPSSGKEAKCVFWDTTTSLWSPSGCSVTSNTGNVVTCSCPFAATRDYSLQAMQSSTSQSPTPTATPNPTPAAGGANVGAIVGGVIGGIVVLGLIIFFLMRRKNS